MGYYVYLRVPDKAVREHVFQFFRDNPPLLLGMEIPKPGKDVCAYAKKDDVGFYYGSAIEGPGRTYIFGLLRWLAMKVGPTMKFRKVDVPFYFYEHDRVPVVRASQFPDITTGWNQNFDLVDEVGVAPSTGVSLEEAMTWEDSSRYKDIALAAHKADALLKVELERLDKLWVCALGGAHARHG